MSHYKNLSIQNRGSFRIITINRPDKLNALNQLTLEEIKEAFREVSNSKEIRGVIVTGAGDKAFVAGADIREFSLVNELNARKFSERGQEVFASIESCQVPVIAAVNGFALGGGCELAMACHLRVAATNARFGLPEVNLGILPGYGGTQRLTQLVGKGKALELIMTGDMIDAEEAKTLGLVNHVVAQGDAVEKAIAILTKISEKAPLAIGMVIDCINSAFTPGVDGYQTEANSFAACCATYDFTEGTAAFLEKRKPIFKGE